MLCSFLPILACFSCCFCAFAHSIDCWLIGLVSLLFQGLPHFCPDLLELYLPAYCFLFLSLRQSDLLLFIKLKTFLVPLVALSATEQDVQLTVWDETPNGTWPSDKALAKNSVPGEISTEFQFTQHAQLRDRLFRYQCLPTTAYIATIRTVANATVRCARFLA